MQRVISQTVRPSIGVKRILLPSEHGSWSFLIEPLIVGLAIAPSYSAPWMAVAVAAAFFARQPLKVYSLARKNPEAASRSLLFFFLFVVTAAAGLTAAVLTSGVHILLPLVIAGPLAMQQLYADAAGRGRSLVAELFGAVAISCSIAMMAAAAGFSWPAAVGFWLIFACRFVPSILYVRNRLLLEKGKKHNSLWPTLAHMVGLAVVVYLAFAGLASLLTATVFVFLLARSILGLSQYRTRMKAMKIGIWEVVYGFATVVSIVAGHYIGV